MPSRMKMGLACIREREDCAHPCPQLAAVDQVCDFRQVLGCDVDEEEGRVDAMALCKVLIRMGYGRNQLAAAAQDLERALLRFAADQIEDGIHIPSRVLEALGLEVDHGVRPELAHKGDFVRWLPSQWFGCRRGGRAVPHRLRHCRPRRE